MTRERCKTYSFTGDVNLVGMISTKFNESQIIAEPMLYGFSIKEALSEGGPITRKVLNIIMHDVEADIVRMAKLGYHPVIDTKSVLLMPGQFPCIPGWHCDGVLRSQRGGQPDLDTLGERVKHYVCVITESGKKHKGTEFIDSEVNIPEPDIDKGSVWRSVDALVDCKKPISPESGHIVSFYRNCLHRGGQADERCARYFFRLSFYHMPAVNQIRNQVQVYTDINAGW